MGRFADQLCLYFLVSFILVQWSSVSMTSNPDASLFFPVFLICLGRVGNYMASGTSYSALSNERMNSALQSSSWTNITGNHIEEVSDCHALSGAVGDRLGHAFLEVYTFRNNYSRTILPKLSFIGPTWSRMDTMLSARNKSFCGSVMTDTSGVKFPYFGFVDDFDDVTLEINVTDGRLVERRKFQFFLPFFPRRNLSNVELWEVFLYVDVSDSRRATVFWERAPAELNITKYQLNVSCGDVAYTEEYEAVFLFEVPFDVTWSEMKCRFYVRPWLSAFSKWGYRSSTPAVIISRREVLHVWVLILCTLLCTLAFLVYRLYRVLGLQCKHRLSGSALLIYEAKTEQQLKFACLLAQTLEEDYGIKIHFDHRDIPLTETKDPLKWFVETLPSCQYFIFLQLPAPGNTTCVPPGIYSSQKMATNNVFQMFKNSARIVMVELDSCPYEETWLCSKLKSRYKYVLPKDLRILVGKEDPFSSPLGCRLKQSISQCIHEIKELKKEMDMPKEACVLESAFSNVNQEGNDTEEEEDREIVVSGRRRLLESFNLSGVQNESDSE